MANVDFTPISETEAERRKRARRISRVVRKIYGKRGCALHFKNPFELLVSTILAAQSTDVGVNLVTPELFRQYPTPEALSKAPPAKVEKLIHSTGFYRQKTKSIIATAKAITAEHNGKVPESMEELTRLPGVGRKTANVVRGTAFDLPAIIVDTHCIRVSQRLGLATSPDPPVIEEQLGELLPKSEWSEFSHSLTWHGRDICHARKPECPRCPVLKDCPFGQESLAPAETAPPQKSKSAKK